MRAMAQSALHPHNEGCITRQAPQGRELPHTDGGSGSREHRHNDPAEEGDNSEGPPDSGQRPDDHNIGGEPMNDDVGRDSEQAQPPRMPRLRRRRQEKSVKKAAVRVASLNLKGYGNPNPNHRNNKWNHVNQLVREKKIAILVVQETHMSEARRAEVEKMFAKRLKIWASPDADSPLARGGVAFVFNKELIEAKAVSVTEVIPGRAVLATARMRQGEVLTFLGVYAPNSPSDNAQFWIDLQQWFESHPRQAKPDIMLGDFNMVEDALDQLPMHGDPNGPVDALDDLKSTFRLRDGWRATFPDTKLYSFIQGGTAATSMMGSIPQRVPSSQSRIDRIYVSNAILESARDWNIQPTGIPGADHHIVSVLVSSEAAPYVGKGHWSFPLHLLHDKPLTKYMKERGYEATTAAASLGGHRSETQNAQRIWSKFKRDILDMAHKQEKAVVPRVLREMRALETERSKVMSNESVSEATRVDNAAKITCQIASLEQKRHQAARKNVAARHHLEGETVCKYWAQSNKAKRPRDMIYALKQPDGQVEKNSHKMAELAREYHDTLQRDGMVFDPAERNEQITSHLDRIETKPSDEQQANLHAKLVDDNVLDALKLSKNGSAAGIDGATYELWKALHERFKADDAKEDKKAFDVVGLLTMVFNDIEGFGVDPTTNFSEGWMCPIYKKNERDLVSNYRPITLLNTDYKLFTKALAMKL
ncbi:Endonuclease/exonuclease/phosphatase, partial [Amylocystis lapponica]